MPERTPDPAPDARALDALREQFHRELMRKSLRIAELELELADQRDRYEDSLSWRVTRPLRVRSFIRSQRAGAAAAGR